MNSVILTVHPLDLHCYLVVECIYIDEIWNSKMQMALGRYKQSLANNAPIGPWSGFSFTKAWQYAIMEELKILLPPRCYQHPRAWTNLIRRLIVNTLPPHAPKGKRNPETTFIYALLDPETKDIRYIGKSNDPQMRLYRHLREKHHTYKNMWLKSLKERGLIPEILILEEVLVSQWQERERYWIAFYREQGFDLANGTDGGDGVHGMSHTPEARAKIGAASKGNQYGKGHKPTPEQKARQSAALLGHEVTKGTRAKISAGKLGKPRNPHSVAKMKASLTGRKLSDETRAKMKGRKHSEEFKIARRAYRASPAAREKMRAAQLNRYAADQERVLMVQAIRADYDSGMKRSELVKKYKMSKSQIARIVKGESWK